MEKIGLEDKLFYDVLDLYVLNAISVYPMSENELIIRLLLLGPLGTHIREEDIINAIKNYLEKGYAVLSDDKYSITDHGKEYVLKMYGEYKNFEDATRMFFGRF